ncbi:MAG: RES family NAD+ phosphorylase [Bacteroidota bacterium]
MIVYRLARSEFATSLNSSGAPNRWNSAREYVIYTSGSASLCALELLAHTSGVRPVGNYKLMKIEIDDSIQILNMDKGNLPQDWNSISNYHLTQDLGSDWYEKKNFLVLKVPSAIIDSEYNYIVNTVHDSFSKHIRLLDTDDFFWDKRFPVS